MRVLPLSLLLALVIGAPAFAGAQAPARGAAATGDIATLERMKEALSRTVVLQERYFAKHGRYTNDRTALDALDDRKPSRWSHPPQVQVLIARPRGWTGEVRVPGLPGRSCVIWVGDRKALAHLPHTARDKREGDEGKPTCVRL